MITPQKLKELGYEVPPGETVARKIAKMEAGKQEKPQKAAIRLPRGRTPNKTEQRFEWYARARWAPSWMAYEAVSLLLPSGTRYTPDWPAVIKGKVFFFEVKGPHIHNERSLHAFKEARSAFPHWCFVFAQWSGGEWLLACEKTNPDFSILDKPPVLDGARQGKNLRKGDRI